MDEKKQVQVVLPKRDYKAEKAFGKFLQTILTPGTKIYPKEPKLK